LPDEAPQGARQAPKETPAARLRVRKGAGASLLASKEDLYAVMALASGLSRFPEVEKVRTQFLSLQRE
jgi:hypothetical protein